MKIGSLNLNDTNISTPGAKTLSWATGNREFKRIVIDKPDDVEISNLELTPNDVKFTVDSITGTVNFKIYGCAWDVDTPTVEGEAIDLDNHIAGDGITKKLIKQ